MLIVGAAVIELQQLIYEIQQHFSLFTFSLIFYVTEVALSMPCLPPNAPRYLAPGDVVELRTNLTSFSTRHVYEW